MKTLFFSFFRIQITYITSFSIDLPGHSGFGMVVDFGRLFETRRLIEGIRTQASSQNPGVY